MKLLHYLAIPALLAAPFAQAELVGHWGMDDTHRGVMADTLATHPGQTGGAASVSGYQGNALYFDGTQSADIAMSVFPTHDFTISFWANVDVTQDQGLFSLRNETGFSNDRHIGIKDGRGYVRVWTRDTRRVYQEPSEEYTAVQDWYFDHGLVNDGQWHQWTLTAETGVGLSMYIDDVLVSQKTDMDHSAFDWESHISLGYSKDIGYTTGSIDELSVFNNAITPTEVNLTDMAAAKINVPAPLTGTLAVAALLAMQWRRRNAV